MAGTLSHAPSSMIDIVIPHVDGAAPGYEALCLQHTGEFVPSHVRELGLLRFVLRSIEVNVPWIHNVVLAVQDDGHLPGWLDRDRVRVVHHREFIADAHLPTFHWATISAHLHRIPDLSERFVIWEDDIFAGRPLAPSDFYAPDGLPRTDPLSAPILPGLERLLGGYQWNLARSRSVIGRYARAHIPRSSLHRACFLFPHMPSAGNRGIWRRMFAELMTDPWFADTVTRRSRGNPVTQPTVDPLVVHANWLDVVERRRLSAGRYLECLRHGAALSLGALLPRGRRPADRVGSFPLINDSARFERRLRTLRQSPPLFFNINDDAYDGYRDNAGTLQPGDAPVNPRSLEPLMSTLQELFPTPSRFERS